MKITQIPINIININIKYILTKLNIFIIGFFSIKDKSRKINRKNIYLEINNKKYEIKFLFKRIRNIKILDILSNFYYIKIPIEDMIDAQINNHIHICYEEDENLLFKKNMGYSYIFRYRRKYLNSKILILKDRNTSVYLRKTLRNKLVVTVRKINKTDYLSQQIKINLAALLSKLYFKNIILMYEKESFKYEESASVLYEKLIDEGYKNIYYIIDKNSQHVNNINSKYKKNIIYKYSIKHYIYFFKANSLIGTESPGHAIDLRIANKRAVRRVYSNKFNYIFLQHGVMYMVSLDAEGRGFFRKGNFMPKKSKIVVSSKEEAKHFIDLGGYTENELYITGLPKFDRNVRNKDADKIVIMPTWRPWEYNRIREDYKQSGYYKMLNEIVSSIPDKLKDKLIIMPHPLFREYLVETELSKYMLEDFIYDDVLKMTDILITDYSSVAYDAFYRGANVIFWWKDKEECMNNYNGHLMLNEENCFGNVYYNGNKLKEDIESIYRQGQNSNYINNYRKIVEFSDNNNTKRLVECLKRDKII